MDRNKFRYNGEGIGRHSSVLDRKLTAALVAELRSRRYEDFARRAQVSAKSEVGEAWRTFDFARGGGQSGKLADKKTAPRHVKANATVHYKGLIFCKSVLSGKDRASALQRAYKIHMNKYRSQKQHTALSASVRKALRIQEQWRDLPLKSARSSNGHHKGL